MTVALLSLLGVALAGLLAQNQWAWSRMDRRLERVEDRLTAMETAHAAFAQKLDDHITNHPPQATHLETAR